MDMFLEMSSLPANMEAVESNLCICSFNCRGLNSVKKEYINRNILVDGKCHFLFLQEHWLSESQLDEELGSICQDFLTTGVSGFDSRDVLSGRPYGGTGILWRRDLRAKVSVVLTKSLRLSAIRVCIDEINFLLINVYMPYEDDDVKSDVFNNELVVIADLIGQHPDCHVIIGGGGFQCGFF